MTVNIPQKAGYVATTKEWDDLVRIAENLGAQVVQRDAALRQMQAERDAAHRDLIATAENWHASEKALDAARAEVARLRAECNDAQAVARAYILRAERAESEVARLRLALEDAYTVGDVVQMRLYIAAALRQPEPAQELTDDERCQLTCWRRDEGYHAPNCPIHGYSVTAPAQDDRLDDESAQLLNETISALSQPAPAERECTCEHVMDGDDVAYTIRDRSCPMHTAPAGGEQA